jgi:hypothetical protein
MKEILTPADFETLFRVAWTGVVQQRYQQGVLNSERALQACIVGALMNAAPSLIALIEPTLYPESKVAREMIPDIWVGQLGSAEALAVLELKFVPFAYPRWEGDIDKLAKILTGPTSYSARTIDPKTGKDSDVSKDGRGQIAICERTLGIFAAVGRDDSAAVETASLCKGFSGKESLLPRFLHAWGMVPSQRNGEKACDIDFGVGRLG